MGTQINPTSLFLKTRTLFSLPDAAGVEISCHDGVLWITLDHDPRDIVLQSGESFTPDVHRRALIYAMKPSILALGMPQHHSMTSGKRTGLASSGIPMQLIAA